MVKNVSGTQERSAEMIRIGKKGNITISEIAQTWKCSTANIAEYLHRLQERENYAYLVDGKGCFRIFKDFN